MGPDAFGGFCEGRNAGDWAMDSLKRMIIYENFFLMYRKLSDLTKFAYFWLNEPHDCYVCLGKDPDRIYSSFQLTLEERARRQLRAKISGKQYNEVMKSVD